jgi:GTP-binding protein
MRAELTHDAGGPEEFPRDGLPEVAVLGRSNVGKSSLINALLGRRNLARTSGRPGKTRRIHFYRVEKAFYLVDLPGFGFAAASRAERRGWKSMVESYLRGARAPLRGAVLLVDVRRGPEEEERQVLEWLHVEGIPASVALTKSDKLSTSRIAPRLQRLAQEIPLPQDRISTVSGRTGRGLGSVAGWIREWTAFELKRPDGEVFPG